MAAFHYKALNQKGKREAGVAEADTERQVRQQLRESGLIPLEVSAVAERDASQQSRKLPLLKGLRKKKISTADLSLLTRQLATLIEAGIPLDEALTGVAEQTEKDHVKAILLGVRSRVMEGYSLAAGMEAFPSAFPKLYRTTVTAGEKSGKLDFILTKLAEHTEQAQKIRQKVKQALIYPTMMTVVSIAVVVFLLIYVVPKIVAVFTQTNQTLPMSTKILIMTSQFLMHYGWYLLIGLCLLTYLFIKLLKRESFRKRFDGWLLRLPVIGKAIRTVNAARFGRTFGILNAAGVPVLEGMQAAAYLVGPLPIRYAIEKAISRVREGAAIHLALKETGYFPPMFIHLVASGEMSGQLEKMLEKAASNQENEVSVLIEGSLTLFEPILILIMGGVVLFIVLAIMLPIFALDQLPA